MIDEFLAYNKQFVTEKAYEPYVTTKYPDKKVAIVSCMDTRLTPKTVTELGIFIKPSKSNHRIQIYI